MYQSQSPPPGPPRRSGAPWTILGIACGGCLLLFIVVAVVIGSFAGKVVRSVSSEMNTPTVPPPKEYVGLWQGSSGGTLNVGADGRGSWREDRRSGMSSSNVHIDGGRVTIDPTKRTLSVTFGGFGKTLHIDKSPTEGKSGLEMELDGETFRHVGQVVPENPNGRAGSSGGRQTNGG